MKTRLLKRLRKYAKMSIYIRIYEDFNEYGIYNRRLDNWYHKYVYDRYPVTFKDLKEVQSDLKMQRIKFILKIVKIKKLKRDLNKYNNKW